MLQAVTELNQVVVMTARQGVTPCDDPDLAYWLKNAPLENQPYLAPDLDMQRKVSTDYSRFGSDDVRQDVHTCIDIAAQKGLETLVLDQTRPDISLHVVKVIVPGLRHFWPRFAPGRLYEVPVRMGWLPAPLTEAQLNPIPMFM
jgi:ribosomal protein S12 methylthiotransferase accessory factor